MSSFFGSLQQTETLSKEGEKNKTENSAPISVAGEKIIQTCTCTSYHHHTPEFHCRLVGPCQ